MSLENDTKKLKNFINHSLCGYYRILFIEQKTSQYEQNT